MKRNCEIPEPQPVSAALVGISGMGLYHLISLQDEFSPEEVELRAVIDPFPERSERYPELKERKIPVFSSLSEFYQSGRSAELVVISSPTHHHVPQSCEALGHGSYVFCEKPVGATVQEADRLIRTADKAQRWVMIGYQWSFSRAIQSLKSDILKGIFGKPVRLKTLCLWPRDEDYYGKSDWLGRKKDEEGRWILDSPANNAMAHFLHNLFYILGERTDRSAQPEEVQAELYRAYSIENFDSAACRAFTRDGVELLFYASHVTYQDRGPMFSFEFEQATVTYGDGANEIVAVSRTGREKHYGSPEEDHPFQKLFEAVESVREPKPVVCGPKAARSQTLCVNGIQESASEIATFPESMVRKEKGKRWWVKGLEEALYSCYLKGILPSEGNFSWARAGKAFDLRNYSFFPGGAPPEGQEA
ncbi:MAG: Gfo/Idh/MocA family oxidoreductase [Candidatus Aminicenantes bacterium]|nr:Gfo/Idh/MocA family oxidoreductase [Candidatus Aminicenantes bacterium]